MKTEFDESTNSRVMFRAIPNGELFCSNGRLFMKAIYGGNNIAVDLSDGYATNWIDNDYVERVTYHPISWGIRT